jgi:hypothetical protein
MTTCRPARTEEATLTPLNKSPGILPFKLGPCKIRQSDHTFLHYINLNGIGDQIRTVDEQIQSLQALCHSTDKAFRFKFNVLDKHISNKLSQAIGKYNSLAKNIYRYKRGLIDGLGSIIRSITGNLDQTDAKKYDEAISILQANQAEIANHFNRDITLNHYFLDNYNETISKLSKNQNQISYKINEMLREINITRQELFGYLQLDTSFTLVEINLQIILETLNNLETALSFSVKGIADHNIVTFENLQYFIQFLSKHYDPSQLVTTDVKESRIFYNFLELASYFSNNMLVFVIKVPILYKPVFEYYHLFPIPTLNSNILVPPKPYLVADENAYQYLEEECLNYGNIYYCQKQTRLYSAREHDDCLYKLIKSQIVSASCSFHNVKIMEEIFEKINDYYYLLFCVKPTKFHVRCKNEEYTTINGSFLLKLPENCSACTEMTSFTNEKSIYRGTPIKLYSLNLEDIRVKNPTEPLKMDKISLNRLYETIGYIQKEQQRVQLVQLSNSEGQQHIYWTTPLYIILIITVLYVAFIKTKARWRPSTQTAQHQTNEEGVRSFCS